MGHGPLEQRGTAHGVAHHCRGHYGPRIHGRLAGALVEHEFIQSLGLGPFAEAEVAVGAPLRQTIVGGSGRKGHEYGNYQYGVTHKHLFLAVIGQAEAGTP